VSRHILSGLQLGTQLRLSDFETTFGNDGSSFFCDAYEVSNSKSPLIRCALAYGRLIVTKLLEDRSVATIRLNCHISQIQEVVVKDGVRPSLSFIIKRLDKQQDITSMGYLLWFSSEKIIKDFLLVLIRMDAEMTS